jgi:cobalamin biosynthetic protein CobC
MLEHGGRLRAAAQHYGTPLSGWIDLSTGIAPHAYPVPPLPPEAWQRLPEDDDGLEAAACRCYGAHRVLALPGSQAAIQLLPRLRPRCRVLLPQPTYAEYALAWRAAGHGVRSCAFADLPQACRNADVVMLGNPNNPTGERLARNELEAMAQELQARGGWLIVDEAFADCVADGGDALAAQAGQAPLDNVVVLRSLGKFFGLAGARVGFAIAADHILDPLADAVGPWAVAHPARVVAQAALADRDWQAAQSARLQRDGARLLALLDASGFKHATGASLFAYVALAETKACQEFFARRGILLRAFDTPSALRVGLPSNETEWQRLTHAFKDWSQR